MAKELDLVKLKHIAIDGTKIKTKASINNLTNQVQVDLLKVSYKRVLNSMKKNMKFSETNHEIQYQKN